MSFGVVGRRIAYYAHPNTGPCPLRPADCAAVLLRDNLLIYGLGGLILPFLGIKLIDMVLVAPKLV